MGQMIEKKTYGAPVKDVVLAPHLAFSISVQVSNTGVTAVDGRKIIPAGTPLGGATSALETRNTVLSVTNTSSNGSTAQGILVYDVDVTNGNATGTLLVRGVIDTSKCPTIDATVKTALKGAITFMNGGNG